MVKINVREITTCTWELEGDTFYCTHDEMYVEDFVEDHIGFQGHYQTESLGYVCADPDCREVLEGSPEEDRADAQADYDYESSREY